MDEWGDQQQRRQYLTYCQSVFAREPETARVASVGGQLAGDSDSRWLTAPAGGLEGGSIENI